MMFKALIMKPTCAMLFVIAFSFLGPNVFAKLNNEQINNVNGINEAMLSPEYWQAKVTSGDSTILSATQISAKNQELFKTNQHMLELENMPSVISRKQLTKLITSISKKPTGKRFFVNQKLVSNDDYIGFEKNLNLDGIQTQQIIKHGVVVRRTDLRTFPTTEKVFKTDNDINLDRFQETALFPAQAVTIYHQSLDGQWYFVSSYNYSAWVAKKDVAIADKEVVLNYRQSESFLVVTGDRVFTSSNPYNSNISEQPLEMGVRLPLVQERDKPILLDGQNTYASHVVKFPTRDDQGKLIIQPALIAKSQDVSLGYLSFNRNNIVRQAFKFLGERYGWGHSFNARDCTGFVGEIYKSFGLLMPRNSGQQGSSDQGENIRFTQSTSRQEKLKEINRLNVGDLIYLPGHVMMYLGQVDEQPYVIHDVAGYSYFDQQGVYQKSQLNGVSVTPLIPLQLNKETSYIDRIYNLKKIK